MREIIIRGKNRNTGQWQYVEVGQGFVGNQNFTNLIGNTMSDYTGCFDISGVAIYVGDIVKSSTMEYGVVRFVGGLGFYESEAADGTILSTELKNCKVVGNIWDNPEYGFTEEDIQ